MKNLFFAFLTGSMIICACKKSMEDAGPSLPKVFAGTFLVQDTLTATVRVLDSLNGVHFVSLPPSHNGSITITLEEIPEALIQVSGVDTSVFMNLSIGQGLKYPIKINAHGVFSYQETQIYNHTYISGNITGNNKILMNKHENNDITPESTSHKYTGTRQ